MGWTVRLPDVLEARLEEYCSSTGANKNATVILALEGFLPGSRRAGTVSGLEDEPLMPRTMGALGEGEPGAAPDVSRLGREVAVPASSEQPRKPVSRATPSPSPSVPASTQRRETVMARKTICEHRISPEAFCKVCDG